MDAPFLVMGIVNVTPDSFSDGGRFLAAEDAVAQGRRLLAEGADILDIGGESTRPGAEPVGAEEEIARTQPVVEALSPHGRVSIDTTKVAVAAGRARGGRGLRQRRQRVPLRARPRRARRRRGRRLLPHAHAGRAADDAGRSALRRRGRPTSRPTWRSAWRSRSDAGVAEERIHLDPGIGFGKTVEHNLELLRRLDEIVAIGRPVLVGTSRKGFLGKLTGRDVGDRVAGTIATNVLAFTRGARIFRVHDVAPVRDALTVTAATVRADGR